MNRFERLAPEPMPDIPPDAEMVVDLKTASEIERERRAFKRDRIGHNGRGTPSRITYVAHGRGYVMARHPGCMPFVISEKDWRNFPYFTADT
jgi:hypothetical protein